MLRTCSLISFTLMANGALPATHSFPTRRSSDLWSVTTRPRRDLIRHLGVWVVVAGLAAVALAAVVGVITGSPELAGSPATEGSSIGAGQLILVLAVALVLGPVQAAGLELPLRGVPLQPPSEEHTSELQSRGHLVCRLLLEKKKNR